MAIDFNATTSKLENTTANLSLTTQFTICAWVFADGAGENGSGRIITFDEAENSLSIYHNYTTGNAIRIEAKGLGGEWYFTALDGVWNAVSISYNGSSTANDPVCRVNFASATTTEDAAPSGTFTQPNTGYCIGNRSAGDRTWDGMLQHIQVANTIWTPGEMNQACRRPGSVRRGLKLWQRMLNSGDLVDLSGNGFNGTGTALTNRVGGSPAASLYTNYPFTTMIGGGGDNRQLTYMGAG